MAEPTTRLAEHRALWGPAVRGIQMRISGPAAIEQRMLLPLSVEFQADRDHLPALPPGPAQRPRVADRLDSFMFPAGVALTLVNVVTGEQFVVEPHDPTSGMPVRDGGDAFISLGDKPSTPIKVEFPLLAAGEAMKPGAYDCTVTYDSARRRPEWTAGGAQALQEFWTGQVSSAPLRIQVDAEVARTQTFFVPKRLHIGADRKVQFGADDAEELKLPVRNGYFTGMRIHRENGMESLANSVFERGSMTIEDLAGEPATGPGAPKLKYTIEIFETGKPAGHMWMPTPGADGYKTLWKQAFEVSPDPVPPKP